MEDSTKNNWNWTVKSKTEDDFSEVSVSNEERQSVDNPVDAPSFRRNVSTVDLEALMEKYKDDVKVLPVDYKYSFGTRENTTRNEVKEYIFVGC